MKPKLLTLEEALQTMKIQAMEDKVKKEAAWQRLPLTDTASAMHEARGYLRGIDAVIKLSRSRSAFQEDLFKAG